MLFDIVKRLMRPDVHSTMLKIKKGSWNAAINVKSVEYNITTNSGTGTQTIGAIPAGCLVLSVVADVTTAMTGSGLTTWSMGISGATDRWAAAKAKDAATTVRMSDYKAAETARYYMASTDIILTAGAGVFTTGQIKVVVHYVDSDALSYSRT